ncbi:MAG: TraR/DksA C4-type zinc finger protein [Humidesulfovibrio sp.]|uniref:TraR/DksA C4-type zinc finger protein n=1 Tax=Humidesulfovibrio sp. TaxID=2910988 RepID=UPI0027EF1D5E|nr:TraR/DksA C4-type zinc finger protein [Humidesulfovibrio sp.]MDQ7833848.1 TraR/DksA C4-type zinc finger protein [Humidesulfovibrio sp.]
MSDAIDEAQRLQAAFLENSLANWQDAGPEEPQLVIDGVVHCVDCEEPIAPARLDKLPKATRCVGCQEEADVQPN